jgi:membrane fusion protein, multidrug efflux system
MQKVVIILILGAVIFSCKPDNKTRLEQLKAQRDKINEQIVELETQINGSDTQPATKLFPVNVTEISPVRFEHYIEVQGTVDSDNNIAVPAEMAGVVKKIHVQKGDAVRKGQLLAELDGSILEKNIEALKTNLELANTMYERQKRLWEQKIGSEMQYLQVKTQKESLEKQIAALNEQYRMTKITAPIAGTVDQVMIREGEAAAPGFPAIRVVQLSDLKVKGELSEAYITSVKKNDPVTLKLPVIDREIKLKVSAVSQVIDPDNRTFMLEINIPGTEKNIRPNMIAVMVINDYVSENAIVVPQNTIQKTGSEDFIFVAEKNENEQWVARRRVVIPGRSYANRAEILSGLNAGEKIISYGFQNLADGQPIAVVN